MLHHLYLNIIFCYFYLELRYSTYLFCRFRGKRGKIYTLSNYLSYQGNDLARSLLLFDSNEVLNYKGYECLNVYFSNLAGYDKKKSWNDRLNILDKITNDFKEYTLNKNEDMKIENLLKISEGIINQEIIKDIPNKLKEIVPKDFEFKELDQKFYAFIKILIISRKQISNKDYMFLVKGLFDVLSDLGVDKNIKIKYKGFYLVSRNIFLKI